MSFKTHPEESQVAVMKRRSAQPAVLNHGLRRDYSHRPPISQSVKLDCATLSPQAILELQRAGGNRNVEALLQQNNQGANSPQEDGTHSELGSVENDGHSDTTEMPSAGSRQQLRNHGGNLPAGVRKKMEAAFGTDFSDVRVHENSSRATELNAKAYTQGDEIHFAPGEYNPETAQGQHILGHELSHIIQNRQGRVKTTHQEKGCDISDQADLEREADHYAIVAANGGKVGRQSLRDPQWDLASIQKKSGPLQLFRSLPTGATILGISPDIDNIYLACSNLAYRVESRVAGNVNWAVRIGRELEASLASNRLVPFRKSFTETEGINFDWTVSINWRINNPRPVGGTTTSEVTRSGGGNVTQSSGTSASTTDSAEASGSIGGHEGAAGGGVKAGTSSTQQTTESQGVTLQGGVSRRGTERAQQYTAQLVASITVSGSANFSGSDYINPLKWGTSVGSAITTSGAQSGDYVGGRVDYLDSRPVE